MAQSSASPRRNFIQILPLHPLGPPSIYLYKDDIATAIEFEKRGDYLALGDRGGRVVIFERDDRQNEDSAPSQHPKFQFKFEFQSHQPEFCHCMNRTITQRIKKVRWCNTQNGLPPILSANDITIRLWKIAGEDNTLQAICQNIYVHDHGSRGVHSISNDSDGQRFISADDFKIVLWNLEVSNQIFNIVGINPAPNMENNYERMTSAEFHISQRDILACGNSRGFVRLCDIRQWNLCTILFQRIPVLEEPTKCISDVKFFDDGLGGQHLLCHDYIYIKLWDLRMNSDPVATFPTHSQLHPRPPELANINDLIYDRFDCCFSGDRLHFATGSYGNLLRIFSPNNGTVEDIKVDDMIVNIGDSLRRWPMSNWTRGLFHVSGHPTSNLVACAVQDRLILYHA